MKPLLAALLTGCAIATAEIPTDGKAKTVDALQVARWDGLDRDGLTRVDVRGTASSIGITLQEVQALSPKRRAEVAESYRVLAVNCPYTRASMQLPLALHQVVISIDTAHLDPLVHRDWANLQRGLTTHVAVLDALEIDLPLPSSGDHLYGLEDELLLQRTALLQTADPVAASLPLIREITPLVQEFDGPTKERIDTNRETVERAVGQATMGLYIGGWENALRKIEPFVDHPGDRDRVRAMIHAMSSWGSQGC